MPTRPSIIRLSLGIGALVSLALFAAACGGDDDDGPNLAPGECVVGDPSCTLRQAVHWHADLGLYINGEEFDFDQPQFVSTEDEELSDAAHIHEPRTNVVHVHLEQTTWNEFFTSLGMKVSDRCVTLAGDAGEYCADDTNNLTFIVNGVRVDSIRELDITDLQRTLIWYGPETADDILPMWQDLVTDEACIPSAKCADRMPENPEDEPCSVLNSTCN